MGALSGCAASDGTDAGTGGGTAGTGGGTAGTGGGTAGTGGGTAGTGGGTAGTGGGTAGTGGGTTGAFVPDDPFFPQQWHLKNTGQAGNNGTAGTVGEDLNVMGAWQSFRGTGVRIAIVDDGLDVAHPDLLANVAAGESYNYLDQGTSPSPDIGSHGTSCGGLAAAVGGNNLGVTGVAAGAQLVGYNLLQASTEANAADAMTRGLTSNQIYSNSWGATDGLGVIAASDATWRAAIDTGLTTGRGGRGAIYTWAAGNGSPTDRSDYDGQANYRGVIAVGALTNTGTKSSYSEAGSNLLVSAYGGEFCDAHTIITTDISGPGGSNDGGIATELPDQNYTKCFNGTSAATPEVSGAIALMLQANPNLTWREVRWVLAHTARRNDTTDPDWATNGAGRHVNHKYGFGVVDATAATALAVGFDAGVNLSGAQRTATGSHGTSAAIADNSATATSSTIALSGSGLAGVEFVEVNITSDHPQWQQLNIELTSPSGTKSQLAVTHDCMMPAGTVAACGANLAGGARFGVARLLGEPADGTWTLAVTDGVAGETGNLVSWNITVYGY